MSNLKSFAMSASVATLMLGTISTAGIVLSATEIAAKEQRVEWTHIARRLIGHETLGEVRGRNAALADLGAFVTAGKGVLLILGEAGLGFDAALDRVLAAQPADRPFVRELRTFQQETLAGVPRWQAFRRIARRVDVPGVSIFVAALVQAEKIRARADSRHQ